MAASIVSIMIIAIVTVALRLVGRYLSSLRFGLDDISITLGLIVTLGVDTCELVAVRLGYGKHLIALAGSHVHNLLKLQWSTQVVFHPAVTLTKLSLLFFYNRIFPFPNFRICTYIAGMLQVLFCIVATCLMTFTCSPVHKYWDDPFHDEGCLNIEALTIGITAADVAMDVVVLILPVPWLAKSQLDRNRKIGLISLCLLGSFVCLTAAIRLPLISQISCADAPYSGVDAGIWLVVEANVGILCACLPIMRPLLKKIFPSPTNRLNRLSRTWSAWSMPGQRKTKMVFDLDKGRAVRVPICQYSSTDSSSGTCDNHIVVKGCQNYGYPVSGVSKQDNGTNPYTKVKDDQAPTVKVTEREPPRLPKNVKVKRGWDAVAVSPIDQGAENRSQSASIEFETIPTWFHEDEWRSKLDWQRKEVDRMSMEHVRAQGSLCVERGVCNDPERLRLERVPMSPIGPIGPISPHFLVSPTSFRSSQGPLSREEERNVG